MRKLIIFMTHFFSIFPEFIEKPIVVLVPSYNNAHYYKKNLDSVFTQKYSNYRVVYINDCSTDGTGLLVDSYVRERNLNNVVIIHNINRLTAMENIYKAIHYYCRDDEIVIKLDGDDWFSDNGVLQKINEVYSSGDVWLTYGNYEDCPRDKARPKDWINCKSLPDEFIIGSVRNYDLWGCYLPGHPLTFYAKLFKKIKLKDLLYKGEFPKMGYDSFMNPAMLELAKKKYKYMPMILYIHNCDNPINDFRVNVSLQRRLALYCSHKKPYKPLNDLFVESDKLDLILLSKNQVRLEQISRIINKEKLNNVYNIEDIDNPCAKLRNVLNDCHSKYIALIDEYDLENIDLNYAIEMLIQTGGLVIFLKFLPTYSTGVTLDGRSKVCMSDFVDPINVNMIIKSCCIIKRSALKKILDRALSLRSEDIYISIKKLILFYNDEEKSKAR